MMLHCIYIRLYVPQMFVSVIISGSYFYELKKKNHSLKQAICYCGHRRYNVCGDFKELFDCI